jgi:methenyltetrahydrofolate cyclohydrolase
MSYRTATLAVFLERLSSDAATPGGGCASALGGALAAGLVAMVARNAGGLDEIVAEADRLRGELEELVDADAAAFDAVLAAFRLPKETDVQKAARSAAVQTAYRGAVEPPLAVCGRARRVLELAALAAERGNPNLASDAGVAAVLAAAALEGAALNVDINLPSIRDEGYRTERARKVEEERAEGTRLREAVLARVGEALR